MTQRLGLNNELFFSSPHGTESFRGNVQREKGTNSIFGSRIKNHPFSSSHHPRASTVCSGSGERLLTPFVILMKSLFLAHSPNRIAYGSRIGRILKNIAGTFAASVPLRLCLLPVILAGCPTASNDTISMDGKSTGEQGALVDGVKDGTFKNDEIFSTSKGGVLSVGNFTNSSGEKRGEIIAFGQGHSPTLMTPVKWTDHSDSITVLLEKEYSIPVYAWIVVVRGTYEKARGTILNSKLQVEQIWTDEKQGIQLDLPSSHIKDASDVKDAQGRKASQRYTYTGQNKFFVFTCATLDTDGPDDRNVMKDIGYKENAINVYYLDHVEGLEGNGDNYAVSCTKEVSINGKKVAAHVIAMGSDTGEDLLAHEFGHQFSLEHVEDNITGEDPCPKDPRNPPYFCDTNVMYPYSLDRIYLTEGQTFRAIVLDQSAINTVNMSRSGTTRATTSCQSHTTATPDCPAIQTRIWQDGPLGLSGP